MQKIKMKLNVNGKNKTVSTYPMARLLDVIREDLKLTGTKEGCGEGECGACSILLDGEIVNSCLVPVGQLANAKIKTIESLATKNQLHRIQKSFIKCGGAQCGICTPGMIIAALRLLKDHPSPKDKDIREGLAGNLCRCTGYMGIFKSVVDACKGAR